MPIKCVSFMSESSPTPSLEDLQGGPYLVVGPQDPNPNLKRSRSTLWERRTDLQSCRVRPILTVRDAQVSELVSALKSVNPYAESWFPGCPASLLVVPLRVFWSYSRFLDFHTGGVCPRVATFGTVWLGDVPLGPEKGCACFDSCLRGGVARSVFRSGRVGFGSAHILRGFRDTFRPRPSRPTPPRAYRGCVDQVRCAPATPGPALVGSLLGTGPW